LSLKNFEDRVEWLMKARGIHRDVDPSEEIDFTILNERGFLSIYRGCINEALRRGHIMSLEEKQDWKIELLNSFQNREDIVYEDVRFVDPYRGGKTVSFGLKTIPAPKLRKEFTMGFMQPNFDDAEYCKREMERIKLQKTTFKKEG